MPTSANVNEPPNPHDQTRDYAKGGTGAMMAVLIVLSLVCLVAEMAVAIQRIETKRVLHEIAPADIVLRGKGTEADRGARDDPSSPVGPAELGRDVGQAFRAGPAVRADAW